MHCVAGFEFLFVRRPPSKRTASGQAVWPRTHPPVCPVPLANQTGRNELLDTLLGGLGLAVEIQLGDVLPGHDPRLEKTAKHGIVAFL